jgi:hypothetical protein
MSKFSEIIVLFLVFISHSLLSIATCPSGGWGNEFTAGGTCYQIISSVTWSAAVTSCTSAGGWLATIETSAEDTFIMTTLASKRRVWIGLTDAAVEGTWVWVKTGTTAAYLNWNTWWRYGRKLCQYPSR